MAHEKEYNKGMKTMHAKKYEDALATWNDLLENDDLGLGMRGKIDEMRKAALSKLTEKNGEHGIAEDKVMAQYYSAENDHEKALVLWNKVLGANAKDDYALYHIALHLSAQGNHDGAVDALEKACNLNSYWGKRSVYQDEFEELTENDRFLALLP